MNKEINPADYRLFIVTGVLRGTGKRFKIETENALYAFGINLWRGSVWGIPKNSARRELLRRVYN